MLRAIAFDLWETLITDPPEVARRQESMRLRALEETLVASGHAVAADAVHRAHRVTWERCQDLYWSNDLDIPTRRQIVHFLEDLGIEPGTMRDEILDALEDVYGNPAFHIPPVLVDGALDTLQHFKARGFAVGMISNTGRTPGNVLRRVLESNGLARHIDAMVFSNEHGECKPRPSIFESLQQSLGAWRDEVAFVGDNLYVDVYGAKSAGMYGIHFIPETRGSAVAPPPTHSFTVEPDATIRSLTELPATIERLGA